MCVEFRNTATEKVGFLMEWTENGTLMPSDLSGRSECRMQSAGNYDCRALHHWFSGHTDFKQADKFSEFINPKTSGKFQADHNVVQGFRLKGLLYDSEYCFRFMAVDIYGVLSGAWSGFACARTPSPAGKPVAPAVPKVTGLQPVSGEGIVGNGTPFRLLVEWSGPQLGADNVGWYGIELWRKPQWVPVPSVSDKNRINFATSFEAQVEAASLGPPEQHQAVRVCSQNIQQKTCSREAWYYGRLMPKQSVTADRELARITPAPRTTLTTASAVATSRASLLVPPANAAPALPEIAAVETRGAEAAAQDPLANELRNRMAEGPARRGFDVGFGIWIGNTAPGPGKQRVHDALNAAEQSGFDVAAAFALPRNKYAALAGVGAAIGNADQEVATARNAENDVFFWLGFDIASGLFGDPAAGSEGSKVLGAGAIAIRDSLNAPAQRGFNASLALHLGRSYQ
jgi:hypothetical protein